MGNEAFPTIYRLKGSLSECLWIRPNTLLRVENKEMTNDKVRRRSCALIYQDTREMALPFTCLLGDAIREP